MFVTNPSIFKEGIKKNIANAILIKLNQIGTLTETLKLWILRKKIIITQWYLIDLEKQRIHLSQTLSVAYSSGQIKTGSLSRSDRVAKYNQLIRIEEQLKNNSHYPGHSIFINE